MLPIALLIAVHSASAPDYVVLPASGSPTVSAVIQKTVLPNAGGGSVGANGYEARVDNAASALRVLGPLGGDPCGRRVRTSATAAAHRCRWAVNGGPFNMSTGDCDEGIFIQNGSVLGTGGWGSVQFGVTRGASWVVGILDPSVAQQLDVSYSIPGFGWLVRDGKLVVQKDAHAPIAPRTAIGTTANGTLLILEVDGCEPRAGCLHRVGRTVYQMAELLLSRGAYHAINLDGGGSSTTVENGTVINHPTNSDRWGEPGERNVTTIVCID
jgi:exopolysaccharide biosynthesis protein